MSTEASLRRQLHKKLKLAVNISNNSKGAINADTSVQKGKPHAERKNGLKGDLKTKKIQSGKQGNDWDFDERKNMKPLDSNRGKKIIYAQAEQKTGGKVKSYSGTTTGASWKGEKKVNSDEFVKGKTSDRSMWVSKNAASQAQRSSSKIKITKEKAQLSNAKHKAQGKEIGKIESAMIDDSGSGLLKNHRQHRSELSKGKNQKIVSTSNSTKRKARVKTGLDDVLEMLDDQPKKKKRVIRIDPYGTSNKRLDDDELRTLLSEQSKELVRAKNLDSDLDFAFQLQMQEAINASLASQPSASTLAPSSSSVSLPEGDINGAVLVRRIFDQRFARDILNIAEHEWRNDGDNFHRPYYKGGASSSSSSSSLRSPSLETENFKMYFKGLVSEERVRDMRVVVASAGIAICDSRDYLIFEVKKPLEAVETGGLVLSSECAELQALIEGLDMAFSLGLQRLTFFSDDSRLYLYVTGRASASHGKLAGLVNQVSRLREKFVSCVPSLVGRNDIKYAFKSARDSIVSQITWSEETDNGKSLKETCVICFEDIDADKMFSVDNCLHRYCFSCMKKHVEVKLLNGIMAKCPHDGCKSEVKVDSCRKFLAPELVEVISQRIKESAIPVTEKVYCPFPKCSALMSKHEVLAYTKTTFTGAEQSGARKCMKCLKFFCINCGVPWHYNMICYDYKRSNLHLQAEDTKLKSLATRKLWRQCVKCNHIVELAEGCYHITCRCGYEFCYTCGAEWKNKKATCSCRIWDERNIIHDRHQRR